MEIVKNNQKDFNENVIAELLSKIKNENQNILKPNIIISGKTGVGKSTVINSVFGKKLVETGVGKPVTQHLQRIESEEVPVVIYDTKGLELKEDVQNQIRDEIVGLINSKFGNKNEAEFIHAIWYCINAGSSRIEEAERELIKELAESVDVPVIVVITQSFPNRQTEDFVRSIDELNMKIKGIIPVMAESYEVAEGIVIPAYGLDKLVEVTYKLIPEAVQKGFINAQKVNLNMKEKLAKKTANNFVKAAFATGFSPVPGSDAPLLVTEQVAMLARITSIFGLPIDQAFFNTVVASLFGSGSATLAGKFIVSNLLKIIPGVGTFTGGIISGSTAAMLTASIARTYIKVMISAVTRMNNNEIMEKDEIFKDLGKIFEQELKTGSQEV